MNFIEAIFLALIQSVTEFLPVSSSGLVYGLSVLFKIDYVTVGLFSAVLHIGSLFAVVLYFRKTFYDLLLEIKSVFSDLIHGHFSVDDDSLTTNRKMLFSLIISTAVSVILMVVLNLVLPQSPKTIFLISGISFLITGFLVFLSETIKKSSSGGYSTRFSLAVGLCQGLSVVLPGISRLASTTSIGSVFGVSKQNTIRYAFVLCVPTMVVSCVLSIIDVSSSSVYIPIIPIVVGFLVSVFLGFVFIKMVTTFIRGKLFNFFGFINTLVGLAFMLIGVVANFGS